LIGWLVQERFYGHVVKSIAEAGKITRRLDKVKLLEVKTKLTKHEWIEFKCAFVFFPGWTLGIYVWEDGRKYEGNWLNGE